MSKTIESSKQFSSVIGTPGFTASEVVLSDNGYDGKKADIFSFGMLVYCILCNTYVFPEIHNARGIDRRIEDGKRPRLDDDDIPEEFKTLIKRCWDQDPNQRLHIDEIVREFLDYENEELDQEEISNFLIFCYENTPQKNISSTQKLSSMKQSSSTKQSSSKK